MEEKKIIYLNNAATSYPKPSCVRETAARAVSTPPPGQFRDGKATDGEDQSAECRDRLGRLLGIADTDRIRFTSGATESLNRILAGLGIPASQIITTVTEHNSVLRPLYNLPGIAGKPVLLPCDQNGFVDPALLEKEAARTQAKAVVLNHCSNVTGVVQDAEAFGEFARRYGLLFILDASQSAGCMEVDADAWHVDAIAFTGHKSLLGLQGTGGFFVRSGVPFRPVRYGGTGRESEKLLYEEEEYVPDAGTQNMPGIASLASAAGWILEKGVEEIRKTEYDLRSQAVEALRNIQGIRLCGDPACEPGKADLTGNGSRRCGPVISFRADSLDADDLGYILRSGYGIVTRTGLHCSPLIHPFIGSDRKGTVRISFSPFNTAEDINVLTDALREIL